MIFVAIDVETANVDRASICQIGIAVFQDQEIIDTWTSLINPQDRFDHISSRVHGITKSDVKEAPTFPQVQKELRQRLSGKICVSHTSFDQTAIEQALQKYNLNPIETTWLDSSRVARRTWEQCAYSGYGLASVCEIIGHTFQHHDALEDAIASGNIIIAAYQKTGFTPKEWLKKVNRRIKFDTKNLKTPKTTSQTPSIKKEANPKGSFYGETITFTGEIGIPRQAAANLAATMGFKVTPGVTKKTTVLVVGHQNATVLAEKTKSSKQIKAEQLIQKGKKIKIISAKEFKTFLSK